MYIFNEEMMHDKDAMWSLGLSFKTYYKIWSEELEKLKTDDYSMNYDGVLIFKYKDEKYFKNAVEDYKQRVRVLEKIIGHDVECKYNHTKYIDKKIIISKR